MGVEPLFFWIFAIGAIVTSLSVVVVRNPLYCALALVVDFFFFAGLYVLLSAHFLAVVQVLVYGGAIMVLFLFIIMLLNLRGDELGQMRFQLHTALAITAGVVLFFIAGGAILSATAPMDGEPPVEGTLVVQDDGSEVRVQEVRTSIPGLYLALDEQTLEEKYLEQIASWERGTSRPSDGKYPRFNPERTFEVPPSMQFDPEAASVVPGRSGLYGTFQPISALLVNRFVVPFELTALLLLAAIIGAVIIAKRRVT